MTEKSPECENPTCFDKGKQKYPSGKGIGPEKELVRVELLIGSPGRRMEVVGSAWVCFTPCLGTFAKGQVKQLINDFLPEESLVRWRYYADYRYVTAKEFARCLPLIFEKMLKNSPPKPKPSSLFFRFFRRWWH
jgi:hypothetical protein